MRAVHSVLAGGSFNPTTRRDVPGVTAKALDVKVRSAQCGAFLLEWLSLCYPHLFKEARITLTNSFCESKFKRRENTGRTTRLKRKVMYQCSNMVATTTVC